MTVPFDRLSNVDIKLILDYIKAFGPGCDEDDCQVEMSKTLDSIASPKYLLRFWNLNKARFIAKAFGDELIVKVPIEYSMPKEEKDGDIWKLITCPLYKEIKDRSYNILEYFWNKPNIPYDDDKYIYQYDKSGILTNPRENFYKNKEGRRINYLYYFLEDTQDLWDNLYSGDTFSIEIKGKTPLKIPHGIKWIRAFTKIATYLGYSSDEIEKFRLEHSMLINTKLLKGNLCFSIHPLDYMTMSDATFGSCMNWRDLGAYRRGTVEMMNSEYVVVVYLDCEHEKLEFEDDEWNMKKWRTLLLVSPQFITSVKSYPYQNNELTVIAINEMKKLVEQAYPEIKYDQPITDFDTSSFCWDVETHNFVNRWDNPQVDYRILDFRCEGAMYCDFGTTTHFILPSNLFDFTQSWIVNYSGESECMFCGEVGDSNDFANTSAVFCNDCQRVCDDDHVTCYSCGRSINIDYAVWNDELDDYLCDSCADEMATRCACCNSTILRSSSVPLILSYKGISNHTKWDIRGMRHSDKPTWKLENISMCTECSNRVKIINESSNTFKEDYADDWWLQSVYNFLGKDATAAQVFKNDDGEQGILISADNKIILDNCWIMGRSSIINTLYYQQAWSLDDRQFTRKEISDIVCAEDDKKLVEAG